MRETICLPQRRRDAEKKIKSKPESAEEAESAESALYCVRTYASAITFPKCGDRVTE